MKAPDKIYLERSLSFPDKFHSHWYKEDVVGNGEEYIRKDALLEWAKEIKKIVSLSGHVSIDDIISHIISKIESL